MNGEGIVCTETTMGTFNDFREEGTPAFIWAGRAAKYASSTGNFVMIMSADNEKCLRQQLVRWRHEDGRVHQSRDLAREPAAVADVRRLLHRSRFPWSPEGHRQGTDFQSGRHDAVLADLQGPPGSAR